MIWTVFLFISVGIVFAVERYVKPWKFRVLLNVVILGAFSGLIFSIAFAAGESSARGTLTREMAVEFDEFTNETNRTAEVNAAIQQLQESLLKIVAAENKE